MLKKSSSFVLARHSRLTISAAFTSMPCLIRHGVNLRGSTYRRVRLASKTLGAHRLAPVRRRDAPYSSRRGPPCGLARDEARLGAPGLGG